MPSPYHCPRAFYSYGDHRELHSFPTRRSSDLEQSGVLARPGQPRPAAVQRPGQRLERSEEHTSELQSHVNLVCRLLLEKKTKRPSLTRAVGTHEIMHVSALVTGVGRAVIEVDV